MQETSTFSFSKDNGSGKLVPLDSHNTHHVPLRLRTLDSIIAESAFTPHLIKIDTDGFDFKVLRGAQNTLQTHKPVIYFEWDRFHLLAQDENPTSIFPMLSSLGYETLLIFDNFGRVLCKVSSDDISNLSLLMDYTLESKQHIYYYDVCAFHSQSALCADKYLQFLANCRTT